MISERSRDGRRLRVLSAGGCSHAFGLSFLVSLSYVLTVLCYNMAGSCMLLARVPIYPNEVYAFIIDGF